MELGWQFTSVCFPSEVGKNCRVKVEASVNSVCCSTELHWSVLGLLWL